MSNNTCLVGSITNCLFYSSQNVCSQCEEGFHISNSICQPHDDVPSNCLVSSQNTVDHCVKCSLDHILVESSRRCKPISYVPFCAAYSSPSTCQTCQDEYQLINNNNCSQIPPGENCLQKEGSICSKCKEDFYFDGTQCVTPPNWVVEHCEEPLIGAESFSCSVCKENAYPLWDQNKFVCLSNKSSTIPGCVSYENASQCHLCEEGRILSSNKTQCLEACPHTIFIMDYSHSQSQMKSMVHTQCKLFAQEPGCELATLEPRTLDPICVKCKGDHIPTTQCGSDLSFVPPDFQTSTAQHNLGQNFKSVKCTAEAANQTFFPSSEPQMANCAEWEEVDSVFYCQQCQFGTTGPVFSAGAHAYVSCDQTVPGCSAAVRFGGAAFDLALDNFFGSSMVDLFTCNHCSDNSQIPFLFASSNLKLLPFNLSSAIPSQAPAPDGLLNACVTPTAAGLQIDPAHFNGSFVEHCALGFLEVDVDQQARLDLNGPSAHCMACKPGYKRTFDDFGKITACAPIANCDPLLQQTWINHCETCSSGFTWEILGNEVNFEKCVVSNISNCLAVSDSDTCQLCAKGYYKNPAGECELASHDLCSEMNYIQSLPLSSANKQGFLYQYLSPKGFGCSVCADGFLGYLNEEWDQACYLSPYVEAGQFSSDQLDGYVPNCVNYTFDQQSVKCWKCDSGFVLAFNGLKCIQEDLNSNLSGCVLSNDTGTACLVCNGNQILQLDQCENPEIPNCASYQQGAQNQTCLSCLTGFYLLNNQCFLGSIVGCNLYDDTGLCTSCLENFALTSVFQAQNNYCILISDDENCRFGTMTTDKDFTCTSCKAGYAFEAGVHTSCFELNSIDNC